MALALSHVPNTPAIESVQFVPWSLPFLHGHATTIHRAFQFEPDVAAFPSLGSDTGCRDLMHAIAPLPNFCPEATWLAYRSNGPVGSVQGVLQKNGMEGEIQNLGVVPEFRGQGIGTALLRHAIKGFQSVGCRQAVLEVSASNESAIKLYRKFGFHPYKTVYLRAYGSPPSLGHGI